jgi:hypothetical protein
MTSSAHPATVHAGGTVPAPPRLLRWVALGATAGPVLFTLAWIVLGAVSPGYVLFGQLITPYSAVTQPISGLGLGPTGPFMNTAFVVGGLLLLAGMIAVIGASTMTPRARAVCGTLLVLPGVGMVMDGVFTLESVLLHLVGFLLVAATPVVSFGVTGVLLRRDPHRRRLGTALLVAAPVTLALVVLFFATFDPLAAGAGTGVAGITQRVLAVEVLAWFAAMGWLAFRRSVADG